MSNIDYCGFSIMSGLVAACTADYFFCNYLPDDMLNRIRKLFFFRLDAIMPTPLHPVLIQNNMRSFVSKELDVKQSLPASLLSHK